MQSSPHISIVIPTHNRHEQLKHCLQALVCLDCAGIQFEVVVVDDGSPMPVCDVVNAFVDTLDVTLVSQNQMGPAAARNAGANRAQGEFLAFIDDDCIPSRGWLVALATQFTMHPDALLGGQLTHDTSINIYAVTSQLILDPDFLYIGGDTNAYISYYGAHSPLRPLLPCNHGAPNG